MILEVNDKGNPLDSEVLKKTDFNHPDKNIEKPETISESGRGLTVIKEFMDKVDYRSDDERNRLIMIKYYQAQ